MCAEVLAGTHQPNPSFEGEEMRTGATSPAASCLQLHITAGLVWGGWMHSHWMTLSISQCCWAGAACAWGQDGEGRSNRKEKALRWH